MRQLDSAGEINPQLLCDASSPQFRNCTTLKSHMTTDRGQPGEEEYSYVLMILSLNTVSQSKQSNTSSSFNCSRPSGIAYIVAEGDCQAMG